MPDVDQHRTAAAAAVDHEDSVDHDLPIDLDTAVDLQTAADELGVHYQTAYRWVRSGRLDAALVDGRYRVTQDAIEQLQRRRVAPAAQAAPSPARRARAADRMLDALLEGDEAAARSIARRLVDEGVSVIDLLQDTVVPPLVEIGRRWHEGELSIWVEHRASAIVDRLLGDVVTNPRGRRRGTVMVAAVAGDMHSLPTTMATVVLRDDNWHVHHLGANVPVEELRQFCGEYRPDVAVLSSTNPDTHADAVAAADQLRAAGTAALVGAPGQTLLDLVTDVRRASAG